MRFIYAHSATALHTSWRSRRTKMNFHGNFIKTPSPIYLLSLRPRAATILICCPRTLQPHISTPPPPYAWLKFVDWIVKQMSFHTLFVLGRVASSSIVGHVVWALFSAIQADTLARECFLSVREEHKKQNTREQREVPAESARRFFLYSEHNGASMMSVGNRKCCKSSWVVYTCRIVVSCKGKCINMASFSIGLVKATIKLSIGLNIY